MMQWETNMTPESMQDVLVVENHRAGAWIAVILLALFGPAVSVALTQSAPAAFALVVVSVIGVAVLAMAWSGFEYRFLRDRVEVRTLGFRLRSIPRQAILGYSVERWPFLGGYGIRGLGGRRAYVWGSKVVHIRTTGGEVFLGHDDPERLVRDLDLVTGTVTRG